VLDFAFAHSLRHDRYVLPGRAGDRMHGGDVADEGGKRLALLGQDPDHDVALGEDPRALALVVEDRNAADSADSHLLSRFDKRGVRANRGDVGAHALAYRDHPGHLFSWSLTRLLLDTRSFSGRNLDAAPEPAHPPSYTGVMVKPRTADPWRETEVIDARAPRFNQAVVGLVALAGVLLGWPLLWALMGAQLLLGLTLGRRFCLTCLAYFELIQPRFGEGELEDSRPPRLANAIGFALLTAAALAWWLGSPTVAAVLAAGVASLALLAAASGFCAGCELYRLSARLRGISPKRQGRIEPADLGLLNGHSRAFVAFTHPLCGECREWERRLAGEPDPLVKLDVRERPDLARKYGIAVVPAVFAVRADGTVLERLAP